MAYDEMEYNEDFTDLENLEDDQEVLVDGTPLSDFGVIATRVDQWNGPERDLDIYHVPGRNGDLIIDHGTYKNHEITYNCSILRNAQERIKDLRGFLYKDFGYRNIEDRKAGIIKKGRIVTPFTPTLYTARNYDTANFDLKFDCKPGAYLISGQKPFVLWQPLLNGTTVRGHVLRGAPGRNEAPQFSKISIIFDDVDTVRDLTISSYTNTGQTAAHSFTISPTDYGTLFEYARKDFEGWEPINRIEIVDNRVDGGQSATDYAIKVDDQTYTQYGSGANTQRIYNPGNVAALPVITVVLDQTTTGYDSFIISVYHEDDGTTAEGAFTNHVSGSGSKAQCVTVDSENQIVHEGVESEEDPIFDHLSGEFPALHPGVNEVTIRRKNAGRTNVTGLCGVQIKPNWSNI